MGVAVCEAVNSEDFSEGFNKFTIAYADVDAIARMSIYTDNDDCILFLTALLKESIWIALTISYQYKPWINNLVFILDGCQIVILSQARTQRF